MTATQTLAALTASAVPESARTHATAAVSEVTAAAASAITDPAITALSDVASALSTPPEAPVPGTDARYSAPWSAYLTATAATLATDRQATDRQAADRQAGTPGSGHGAERSSGADGAAPRYAAAVVPAALAVGAEQDRRPDAVADAVAIGLDVARRVDDALGDALGAFDRTATIGHLAAVAAAARLLGLTPDQAAHAYGIAGTQAAGFAATASGPVGALQVGKAAADAVEAAYLARDGYTASPAGIEGRRGFAALLAPDADPAAVDPAPTVPAS